MTRKEHLEFCKKCQNRKFDSKQGIVCGLTMTIADFEEYCKDYKNDPNVKEAIKENPEEYISTQTIELDEKSIESLKQYQDFYYAVVGGLFATFIGALIWAAITVATEMQIGFMAVGIGFLVGFTIQFFGAGIDKKFGILGAVLSIFGCLLGNLFSQVGFIANSEGFGYFETLTYLDLSLSINILIESFDPMDLLFYGIAVYEGYRFAFRQLNNTQIAGLQSGKYDGTPVNQNLRMPLVIVSILAIAGFLWKTNQGINGHKVYYYDSGETLSEGEMVKSEEQGLWTYYFENGQIQATGYYLDGIPDSTWMWYDESNRLIRKGTYKNGLENGVWMSFYENGQMVDSGCFVDSRMQGLWKSWHENGMVNQIQHYDRNRADSLWLAYFDNGNPSFNGRMEDGNPIGKWEFYFDNGKKAEELYYDSNDQLLIINSWSLDGVQMVKDGFGMYQSFSETGDVLAEGRVENQKKIGKWLNYYANGNLKEEGEYKNEEYFLLNYYDEEGNQLIENGNGTYESYFADSENLLERGVIQDGLKEGHWEVFHEQTQNVAEALEYIKGKLNGKVNYYYESGALYVEGEMVNDLREGEWIWYYENGGISSRVSYKNNKKQGEQELWSEVGEKMKTEYYEDDLLIDEKLL